jgi:hypothetical protein
MRIVVTREHGPLKRETWTFAPIENDRRDGYFLRLETYRLETRESTRHRKWEHDPKQSYDRFSYRYDPGMKREAVPLPEDVKKEALLRFYNSVEVSE